MGLLSSSTASACCRASIVEINNAADFQRIMQRFIGDPGAMTEAGRHAGRFVEQMTGATRKILADVKL